MLSDDFLQELKYKNDITEVISSYVSLKRSGSNMVGLCPFHSEDTPSFFVYKETDSFYCFGCATGGDVITFIKKIENLDYLEAIKFLAKRSGMNFQDNDNGDQSLQQRQRIFEANRISARFFHSMLHSEQGISALNYFKDRGLTERTIRHFGLGYSDKDKFSLINHLRQQGFKDQEIISANLAYKNQNGTLIDRFLDRVIFPIIDLRGNVIAFGGRTMRDIKPKYLNTSDTLVFKKSTNLFALNFAKKKKSARLILTEGYMDVIALHQAGFTETVATLGTALTEQQARIMKFYAGEVVISYDADEAGKKATERAIKILRAAGINVKVLTIPKGKDPDEYIRSFKEEGSVRFKKLLNSSSNDIEYKLNKIKNSVDVNLTEGKITFLKESVKVLSDIGDEVERDVYITKLSMELNVDKWALKNQVDKERRKKEKVTAKREFQKIKENTFAVRDTVNKEKKDNLRAASAEEAIISYIMKNPDESTDIFLKLPEDKFCTSFNRRVYSYIKDIMKRKNSISISDLSPNFSDDELSSIVKILVSDLSKFRAQGSYQDYINVILEERDKMDLNGKQLEDVSDIKNYLERLKKQKK